MVYSHSSWEIKSNEFVALINISALESSIHFLQQGKRENLHDRVGFHETNKILWCTFPPLPLFPLYDSLANQTVTDNFSFLITQIDIGWFYILMT